MSKQPNNYSKNLRKKARELHQYLEERDGPAPKSNPNRDENLTLDEQILHDVARDTGRSVEEVQEELALFGIAL